MSRLRVLIATVATAALAAGALTWAAPAQAAGGITVTATTGQVSVQGTGDLSSGEIVVAGTPSTIYVYVEPEGGGSLALTPGSGCQAESPPGVEAGASVACRALSGTFSTVTISLMLATLSSSAPVGVAISESLMVSVTYFGSFDKDEFYGGPGPDVILGYGGDDNLFGGGGDDAIFGGDGADEIDGEGGNDTIYGDAGPDSITAEGDGKAADWINCNNYMPGVIGTNNDPANPPTNDVSFDKGADRITDCGEPGAPGITKAPALTGTPTVGRNYTASAGTWTGRGLIMSYAWFACPKADDTIPFTDDDPAGACTQVLAKDGVPGLTYKPKASDRGKFLKLRSTARNNAGFWSVVSAASPAVVTRK